MQHELERLFDALWQRSIDIEREMCVFSKTLFSHVFPTSFKSQLSCRLLNTSTHPNWSKSHSRGCEEIHYSIFHETLTFFLIVHTIEQQNVSLSHLICFPFFPLLLFSSQPKQQPRQEEKNQMKLLKTQPAHGEERMGLERCVCSELQWVSRSYSHFIVVVLQFTILSLPFIFHLDMMFHWVAIKREEMCSNKNVYKQAGEREADEWMNQEAQLLLCRTGARSSKKMSFLLSI